MAIFN